MAYCDGGTRQDEGAPVGLDLEYSPCPLGCAASDAPVLTGSDRLHGLPGQFTVVRCGTCGLMRTNPRPTEQAMAAYYPESYDPYRSSRVGEGGAKGVVGRWASDVMDSNGTRLPTLTPGRMLEIGCASGSFLAAMEGRGWTVRGIEPNMGAAAASTAAGFDVDVGSIGSAPDPSEPYDLIVGWMVLEHLHHPVSDLRRLAAWIRPGGWLALSVPNAGSWELGHFRDAWYALQLPTHLSHFSPATATALLAQSGWTVERILHQRNLKNITESLSYRAGDCGRSGLSERLRRLPVNSGPLRIASYPLAAALAAMRQSGRMTIWARPSHASGAPTS